MYYVMKKGYPHDYEVYTAETEQEAKGAVEFFTQGSPESKYYYRKVTESEIHQMALQFAAAQ
jgi:hypothetical protein